MQDGGTVSLGEVGLGKRKGKVKSAHVWLGPSETRFRKRFACRFPRRRSNGNAGGRSTRLHYTSMDLISSHCQGARDEAVLTLMIQQVERDLNHPSVANRSLFTPCILLRASTLSQHADETGKPERGLTRRSKSQVLVPG